MADQALSSMYVTLGLNTVDFQAGADDAKKIAASTAGDIDKSFGSLTESRHGLMLAEEAIGVRLPRSLNTLLAKIPAVSTAFSAILPIAGIAVGLEIIGKLIEKHDALAVAAHKAATEASNLAIKEDDQTKSMELANLKLEDQVAKLEGRPNTNRLKEALLESGVASDKLAESFVSNFEKVDDGIMKTVGIIGTLKTIFTTFVSESFWDELQDAMKVFVNPFAAGSTKAKETADEIKNAVNDVTEQMLKVGAAQRDVDKATTQEQLVAALNKEKDAYTDLAARAESAYDAAKAGMGENAPLTQQLAQGWTMAEHAVKNLGIQISDVGLRARVAADENQDATDKIASDWETHLIKMNNDFVKNLADYRKGKADKAKADEHDADLEREADAAVAAALKKYADDEIKRNHDLMASYQMLAVEKIKLNANAQAEGVKAQAGAGLISAIEEQNQLKAIYAKELSDLQAHDKEMLATQQGYVTQLKSMAAAAPTGSEAQSKLLDEAAKAQEKLNEDTKQFMTLEASVKKELDGTNTSLTKLQSSWTTYFAKMGQQTQQLGLLIRENLQASMTKAIDTISTSFAKMVVEGKSMGAAMKALAKEIAESFISMLVKEAIQYVIHKLIMTAADKLAAVQQITTAAAVAGAGGVASMAAAPFPLDMGAPAFGAAMMADSLSYAGLLPAAQGAFINAPVGTGVPIMAHGQELVLPAGLSRGLTALISRGGGRPTIVNMAIQTQDADSFRMSSGQTTAKLSREMNRVAARNG
jgi:hypothetical protein